MSILQYRIAPNYSNRTLFYSEDRACAALRREMEALNYGEITIREVMPFCHDEGSLAEPIALGMIEPEDIDRLTEAFVGGFDPVHPASPQWNDASTWWASVPTSDEAAQYAAMLGEWDDPAAEWPVVPPPDLEPNEDWHSFGQWSASLDARNPWDYEEAELAEVGIIRR